jgi:serine/threonine protein kinase
MSAPADAAGMADLIARTGLLPDAEVKEFLFEFEDKKAPAADFVRMLERKGKLTPFQGSKLLKGDRDGYFMGGYRILYKIASGSFGRVYRGDDPRSGQIVAIKVLRRKWSEDAKQIKQFEEEGRLGLTLQHPNIVRILAVGKDSSTDSHFLVMEFVEGGNLRDILNIRKKMDLPSALKILAESADGLAHAYSRGLTHRDIKPSNILLGTDGCAKLVDFGLCEANQATPSVAELLAKAKGKKGEEPKDEQAARTVEYAGLERATGVKSGDIRSDIYFLGHVLFEMLLGEPLMARTRDKRIASDKRRFEEADEIAANKMKAAELPPVVRTMLSKALSYNPMQRYQQPEQFLEAIQHCRRELGFLNETSGTVAEDPSESNEEAPSYPTGTPTLVLVEKNAKLQEALRDRFTRMGFRTLVTSQIEQAVTRYQSKPYHALVVDAGTVGVGGVSGLTETLDLATDKNLYMAGVLILNVDDAALAVDFVEDARVGVLIRPVTMKQLADKLVELLPGIAQKTDE